MFLGSADDDGYVQYRDPRTGRTFFSDGDPELDCPSGPYGDDDDDFDFDDIDDDEEDED